MNATERRNCIVQFVNANREVSFNAIKSIFPDVSDMTIRRDMEYLSQNNKIVRVFGGAKSVDYLVGYSEAVFTKRSVEQAESKIAIAKKALTLLKKDSVFFLGSGTTTGQFAKIIPNGQHFIITTGLNCAMDLSALPDVSILMLGGSVNKNSYCVNGTIANELLDKLHFDTAFLGVSGYLQGSGFTTSVAEDYTLRKKIVQHSESTVILMDSTKVGRTGINTFTFASLDEIQYVVSDDALPLEVRKEMEAGGIVVL